MIMELLKSTGGCHHESLVPFDIPELVALEVYLELPLAALEGDDLESDAGPFLGSEGSHAK